LVGLGGGPAPLHDAEDPKGAADHCVKSFALGKRTSGSSTSTLSFAKSRRPRPNRSLQKGRGAGGTPSASGQKRKKKGKPGDDGQITIRLFKLAEGGTSRGSAMYFLLEGRGGL